MDDIPSSGSSAKLTRQFKVGDLDKYVTFTVTYTVNSPGYDVINDWDVSGDGFILIGGFLHKKVKSREDSKGPAYIRYDNVTMRGGNILYDIGVAVGVDKAESIIKISEGLDSWVSYLANAFLRH